jgi:hypothetical protein
MRAADADAADAAGTSSVEAQQRAMYVAIANNRMGRLVATNGSQTSL